jgi:hypothetical protein
MRPADIVEKVGGANAVTRQGQICGRRGGNVRLHVPVTMANSYIV